MAITICVLKDGLISSVLKGHAVLLALAVSGVWLLAGHGCFRKGNSVGAFLWGGIAVLILFAFSVHELLSWHGSWANLLLPIAGIAGESKLLGSWMRQGGRGTGTPWVLNGGEGGRREEGKGIIYSAPSGRSVSKKSSRANRQASDLVLAHGALGSAACPN